MLIFTLSNKAFLSHFQDVVYGSAYFSGKQDNPHSVLHLKVFIGLEYCDQVALADGLVLTNQSIGVAIHVSPSTPQ